MERASNGTNLATSTPAPLVIPHTPLNVRPVPPTGGGGLHHTMEALQQFQYNQNKIFLRRLQCLVFPMLFCQSHGPPPQGGGLQRGGGGLLFFFGSDQDELA